MSPAVWCACQCRLCGLVSVSFECCRVACARWAKAAVAFRRSPARDVSPPRIYCQLKTVSGAGRRSYICTWNVRPIAGRAMTSTESPPEFQWGVLTAMTPPPSHCRSAPVAPFLLFVRLMPAADSSVRSLPAEARIAPVLVHPTSQHMAGLPGTGAAVHG